MISRHGTRLARRLTNNAAARPARRLALLGACAAALLSAHAATAQPAHAAQGLTLPQAIAMGQKQSLKARAATSDREAARARDRAFHDRLFPQLSIGGTAPDYNRSIVAVTQPDGSTLFQPLQQTNANAALSISQQLPLTGATVTFSSNLAQTKYTGASELLSYNSTPYSLSISQPLLRSNTLKWNGREQSLSSDEAERRYLEAREDVAASVTDAFFNYYTAQTQLKNAEANVAVNDTLYRLNQGRFEVGKIGENDLGQSELQLLRARTSLDGAKLDLDRSLAALQIALNVGPGTPLDIMVSDSVPVVDADTTKAVAQALRNSSAIEDLELQDVDASRRISEARWNGGPGATLQATYGFNGTGGTTNLAYQDLREAQKLQIFVSMPLIQWGAHSADVEAAQASRESLRNTAQATRQQTAMDARFAALQLSQARRQLLLSAKADTVAQKRYDVAYNRYVIGRITIDNLFIAQNDKDQSLLAYVQALHGYWSDYYRLRRLTLFDFENDVPIRP